jgi:hypothetical protein
MEAAAMTRGNRTEERDAPTAAAAVHAGGEGTTPLSGQPATTDSGTYNEPPLTDREKTLYLAFAAAVAFTMLLIGAVVFGLSHSPLVN